MKTLKTAGLVIVILFLVGVAMLFSFRQTIPNLNSQERPPTIDGSIEFTDAIESSWRQLNTLRMDKMYPSISVAVYHDGRAIWSEAIGYSDIENNKLVDVTTRYAIGSISKPITATLVMKLFEAGRIDLDSPIGDYANNLPEEYGNITLRQLLSHQAGVRHYKLAWTPPYFTEFGLNREFTSVRESIRLFTKDPLLFEPDDGFQYTTFGFTLIAYVLQEATGTPFPELLEELVLRPMALSDTQTDTRDPEPSNRTIDYLVLPGRLGVSQTPATNSSHKLGGGGYVSTPTDLGRFGDTLLAGRFLNDETFSEMTTPRQTLDGSTNEQSYGLGWRRGGIVYPTDSDNIVPLFHHGGTAVGSECALVLSPEFGMTVAICGNSYTGGSGSLIQLAVSMTRYFFEDLEKNK